MTVLDLESSAPETRAGWRYGLWLVLLAWGLEVFILWSRPYAPLIDLPNHMARHYLEHLQFSGQAVPGCYEISYEVLPNLGGDLVIPALLTVFSVPTAAKIFLTLSVILYWLGPALFILHCSGYRPAAWLAALLLLPLTWSGHFFWGFLNYYSGLGLAFLVLTHYLWLADRQRIRLPGLVVHALLVALLLLWHLVPFGVYCVIMACHLSVTTLQRWHQQGVAIRLGRAALFALCLLPAAALYAYYTAHHAGIDPSVRYNWGGWARKILEPLSLFHTYGWKCDLLVVLLWLAVALIFFGRRSIGNWRPSWPLLATAVLATCYLIIPYQLGSTDDTDARLLPAILVCALTALVSRLPAAPLPLPRLRLATTLLTVCLVVRFVSIAHAWDDLDNRLQPLARVMEHIEPDSRVLPVLLFPEVSNRYPERHFLAWAVPAKHIFYPGLLHHRDQQPLIFRKAAPFTVRQRPNCWEVEREETQRCYDYVCVVRLTDKAVHIPPEFERVFADGSVTLWRVR